jgi:hypothetical protein
MVASKLSEPLLFHITATSKVVSMVIVVEWPEPKHPQALKGALTTESRSQDPDPAEGPRDQEAFGSQLPEPTLSLEHQIWSQLLEVPSGPEDQQAFGSQISEPTLGPDSQHTTGSQPLEMPWGPRVQEPPDPEPMEIDPPDPPRRVWTVQRLVYYISEVLHDAKIRYLEVHKLLYTFLIASRKLCHYFQAHRISVVTSYTLKVVLHNPNATGNIAK